MSSSPNSENDRLLQLETFLRKNIRGQGHVIPHIIERIKIGETGLATAGRPKGSFIFIGPTGVGKTEITRLISQFLFQVDEPFRMDMSEFQHPDSVKNFIGDESGNLGRLGDILAAHSCGVLLFDEVEKAYKNIIDNLLQILGDGRITCGKGKVFSLSQFYIVLTSNIGSADILGSKHLNITRIEKHILAELAAAFRPEFCARINKKLVFQKLSYDIQLEIAQLNLERENVFLAQLGHQITFAPDALDFLILVGFDKYHGARPLRDAMENHIRGPIANHLVEKKLKKTAGHLSVHPAKTHLVFTPCAP